MNDRAGELVRSLNLAEHPEGGFYREIFRSSRAVFGEGERRERTALTTILYLLPAGDRSRWHRIGSDEIWHFLEGAPLELFTLEPDRMTLSRRVLGPVAGNRGPVEVVPADHWQAARSTGSYTLAGCSVGPGFEFEDFRLLGDDARMEARLREAFPDLAEMI